MKTVHNLASDQSWSFDDNTTRGYCLAYAMADLENEQVEFFHIVRDHKLVTLLGVLPFEEGKRSISLGDLCILK